MVLHVDIGEILALAWNNPLYTSGLVLLFTPPVFRVIIFFYPLLISTALCAAALVSVGQQIEASREREIAGWNAKVVDGDGLVSRIGSATNPQDNSPGEDAWRKCVQDFEPSRSASDYDSVRSNWAKLDNKDEGLRSNWTTLDNKDEGLRSNWAKLDYEDEGLMKHQFRVDDGRMVFLDDQDLLDRHIEAFREYERQFSVKTRAEAAAAAAIAASLGTSSSPSTQTIPVPDRGDSNCEVPSQTIPPMFLYNLRTGGTGRAGKGTSETKAEARLSGGSTGALASSGISSSASTRTIPVPGKCDRDGGAPIDSSGTTSSFSTKMASVQEKHGFDCACPERKIPPMVLYNLRTGGTGTAGNPSRETAGDPRFSPSGAPAAAVTGSQEKAHVAEGLPYSNIDGISRNVNVVESSFGTQPLLSVPQQKQKQSRSVFETGTNATTPVAAMEGSHFGPAKTLNHSASTKNVPWPGSVIKPPYRSEPESFTKTFGGLEKDRLEKSSSSKKGPAIISSGSPSLATRSEESHRSPSGKVSLKRLFAPLGPRIESTKVASRVASPAKPVEDRRARMSNSASRSGNAVIYNAGSNSSAVPSTRKTSRSVQRK